MKLKFMLIVAIILTVSLSCIYALADNTEFEGEQTAGEIGEALSDAVNALAESGNSSTSAPYALKETDKTAKTAAIVLGEPVSEEYFNMRKALYSACGSENPESDAFNAIKVEVYEREFAAQNNLLPTEAEIKALSDDMRNLAESTEESHAILKSLVDSLGMTEDEYWSYQQKYEAPLILIRERVSKYSAENNLALKSAEEIEGELLVNDQAE